MNKIAIRINMSALFEDERRLVMIMVDDSWTQVADLQDRVENLFNINVIRFISSDGYFLHPMESIDVVKICRNLKAFVPKHTLDIRPIQVITETIENCVIVEDTNVKTKKRKHCGLLSSTPYQRKRKKSTKLELLNQPYPNNISNEITSTNEYVDVPMVYNEPITETCDTKNIIPSVSNDMAHDKEQRESKEIDDVLQTEEVINAKQTLKKTTFSNKVCHSRKPIHMYFDDNCEIVLPNPSKPKKTNKIVNNKMTSSNKGNLLFHCKLGETGNNDPNLDDLKPRIFYMNPVKSDKNKLQIQECLIFKPNENGTFLSAITENQKFNIASHISNVETSPNVKENTTNSMPDKLKSPENLKEDIIETLDSSKTNKINDETKKYFDHKKKVNRATSGDLDSSDLEMFDVIEINETEDDIENV